MLPYERRQKILAALEKNEIVNIEDLSRILEGVSQSTVRRDLKILEQEGRVDILRGGAATIKSDSKDTPLYSRNLINIDQKEAIAKTAAKLVKDGEVIYLDAGSTTLKMVKHLINKQITIATTNAMVFSEIMNSKIHCIMIGGDILTDTASIVGPLTDNTLADMYFDKAFLGATGYDLKFGINTPDFRESNKKQIVKNNSGKTYVMVDTSKEGKKTMCKAFELSECVLITERKTEFLEKNAKYMVAE